MSNSKGERINQLTPATDYDVKRMIFSEPQAGSVPNTPITYKRISISTLNQDGSVGDLILPTERVFSFGVSENINPETKKVNGHVLPLCLYNRDGASKAEKAWVETFNAIVEHCKDHLIQNKEEIEQYDLAKSDLKKFNPLYWKRDKGKIVKGTGPTLYAKLIASKKHNKILSMFFDENGESVDPLTLLGRYCYAKAAVKIESIFIGNKISLQVKLYEVEVKMMESGMRPLLSRPKARQRVLTGKAKTLNDVKEEEENQDEDISDGSIQGSDTEEEEEPKPKPKKVVRRVKRVKKKGA